MYFSPPPKIKTYLKYYEGESNVGKYVTTNVTMKTKQIGFKSFIIKLHCIFADYILFLDLNRYL